MCNDCFSYYFLVKCLFRNIIQKSYANERRKRKEGKMRMACVSPTLDNAHLYVFKFSEEFSLEDGKVFFCIVFISICKFSHETIFLYYFNFKNIILIIFIVCMYVFFVISRIFSQNYNTCDLFFFV